MTDGSRVRTVTSRALLLLGCFDDAHPTLTLSQLSRRSGLPLATAHRLLAELVGWGALERGEDGRFVVGRRLWQLGLLAPVHTELRSVALPFMQDLYDTTRENVHLAVREGLSAMYVERISGRDSVPVVSRAGSRLPLHATGVGKALLAHAPDDVVEAVLGDLRPVTVHTVTDPRALRRELTEIRRRGFARTSEEMSLGTFSVAVPVTGADGTVVAALGLVGTTGRRELARLVLAVQLTAASISRRHGPRVRRG